MDRSLARRILLVALAIGVLADIALDGPAFGLNLPLLTTAMLAAAWLLRRPGRAPDPLDAWLPVSALVLAALPSLPAQERKRVLRLLYERRFELSKEAAYASPFAWNLGRERAKASLATLP